MFPVTPFSATSSPLYPIADTIADIYHASWHQWLHSPNRRTSEHRNAAVERMRNCLLNASSELDLSGLNLRSLPALLPPCDALYLKYNKLETLATPLPEGLLTLSMARNPLHTLSHPLPATLNALDISECEFCNLPALPDGLRLLLAAGNPLYRLPEQLPSQLDKLSLQRCRISELPARLPENLGTLNLSMNQLTAFPEHWPEKLTTLNLDANGLHWLPDNLPQQLKHLMIVANPLSRLPDTLPDSLEELDASRCNLTTLPERLPANLKQLCLPSNFLPTLPDSLPDTLQALCLEYNSLRSLPSELPASLTELVLLGNPLTALPDNLPDSLQRLNASYCQLQALPSQLPSGLRVLEVINNRLTRLPETLFSLSPECVVHIGANPLSERTQRALQALNSRANYRGPSFFTDQLIATTAWQAPPLSEETQSWFPPTQRAAIAPQWQEIQNEDNACWFSCFLQRLGETVNAQQDTTFRTRIADWLTRLADSPQLRELSFCLAQEATTHCEDRVTWYLHQMLSLEKVLQVENGHYDNRLPELVLLARQLFRLEQLEVIARKKVASLHVVDEIEVWLAFQVKLRETLGLESIASQMRFFEVSSVSEADLAQAVKQVQVSEREHFAGWLAQWSPWKSVLVRLVPAACAATERRRQALAEEFHPELKNEEATTALREAGAENDEEAKAAISKTIFERRQQMLDLKLTRHFLKGRGLAGLLAATEPAQTTIR